MAPNFIKMPKRIAKLDILLGLQWGDEGKGKIVDVLAARYPAVARFQGGPNAGHTLEFEGKKFVLRSAPSGIFREGTYNLIGNGVVLDPITFAEEIAMLEKAGHQPRKTLYVSRKTHLILPTHRLLDAAYELRKGEERIGSTGKGIAPTYTDKVARNGLRVGDLEASDFRAKYDHLKRYHLDTLAGLKFPADNLKEEEQQWFESIEVLRQFSFVDSEYETNRLLDEGKTILGEGAQGTLLDVEFGTYPFVTSSNTIAAGACSGLGVSPRRVGEIYGIFKAYCTRVGEGPFPTELHGELSEKMQKQGNEFGSVTGRPRRCGWLDLTALKYAVMISGVTKLIMTKADVLAGFDVIRAAVGYQLDGKRLDQLPFSLNGEIKPIYHDFAPWSGELSALRRYQDLPVALKRYIEFIEEYVGVPVAIVSLGPDRQETIFR